MIGALKQLEADRKAKDVAQEVGEFAAQTARSAKYLYERQRIQTPSLATRAPHHGSNRTKEHQKIVVFLRERKRGAKSNRQASNGTCRA